MKSWRFLANRVKWLAAIIGVALGVMVLAYVPALGMGAPLWPLGVALAVLALVVILAYFGVARPYMRLERMTHLFLDGYTIQSLNSEVSLSPATQQLVQRVMDEFNASHLLKLSKRQAQYRALQNQINPHFLYNTLDSIRSEALIAGLDTVADMTEALAVFFRYTISKVENLVSVEEELQNCETYFRIQQYRFGPRLQLDITCDPDEREEIYRCRLPKLTLQPILENSVIHGTESKVDAGHLSIHLERTGTRLLITVSDDGTGMDDNTLARLNEQLGKSGRAFQDSAQSKTGGVALVNVHNRIHLLFGEEYGLHIYSMAGVGTDVEIVLPIIQSDREVAS